MKRQPCETCGKSHQTFSRMESCRQKARKTECGCPPYWRRRWETHSFVYDCPLAREGG